MSGPECASAGPPTAPTATARPEKTVDVMRRPAVIIVLAVLAAAGLTATIYLSGVFFVLGAGLVVIGIIGLLNAVIGWIRDALGRPPHKSWVVNTVIVLASITVTLAIIEAYFAYAESAAVRTPPEAAAATETSVASSAQSAADVWKMEVPLAPEAAAVMAARKGVVTMPQEWERHPTQVPGAARANYWHNVLHVYDENSFRRSSPFPPKQDGVMRVLIIGDSMTYGTGVDQKWTFPSVLQTIMEPEYRIEVIALGNEGAQSEDILKKILQRFVPELKPDLVIYAVCQNDFLDSGKGQYSGADRYQVPIPQAWKTFFNERSRVARYLDDGYDTLLRRLHLRATFYQDILRNVHGYQQRFARDAKAMNDFARENGLPPITAMVVDQYPNIDGLGYQITIAAEKYLRAAGMDVIPTDPYYQKYHKKPMPVSRWEGHPNEMAHAIFAAMLRAGLERNPALAPYRKQ